MLCTQVVLPADKHNDNDLVCFSLVQQASCTLSSAQSAATWSFSCLWWLPSSKITKVIFEQNWLFLRAGDPCMVVLHKNYKKPFLLKNGFFVIFVLGSHQLSALHFSTWTWISFSAEVSWPTAEIIFIWIGNKVWRKPLQFLKSKINCLPHIVFSRKRQIFVDCLLCTGNSNCGTSTFS